MFFFTVVLPESTTEGLAYPMKRLKENTQKNMLNFYFGWNTRVNSYIK